MERKIPRVRNLLPLFSWETDLGEDSFYVKFWSLQKYLKNPLILHNQAMLDEFKPKLDYVLNKFAVIEQERMRLRQTAARSSNAAVDQKMDIVIGSEEKSEYYPGFLKSRQLFDLQVPTLFSHTLLTSSRWQTRNSDEQSYSKSWS